MNEYEDIEKIFSSTEDNNLELFEKYGFIKPTDEEIQRVNEHLKRALAPDTITQEEWERLDREWYEELDKDLERDYLELVEEIERQKDTGIDAIDFDEIE